MLSIATCIVKSNNRSYLERLDLLERVVSFSNKREVDLICLPSGYFLVADETEKKKVVKDIKGLSDKYKISLSVGIDLKKKLNKKNSMKVGRYEDSNIKRNKLPYFLALVEYRKDVRIFRQRSIRSGQEKIASEYCGENRYIIIKGKKVYFMLCGELFNKIIRSYLVDNDIDITIDHIHYLHQFRFSASAKNLSNYGVSVLSCGHANPIASKFQAFQARGKYKYREVLKRKIIADSNDLYAAINIRNYK